MPRYYQYAALAHSVGHDSWREQDRVCVMRMEEGWTRGQWQPRWKSRFATMTLWACWREAGVAGSRLLVETLPRIADGSVTLKAQDEAGATWRRS